MLARRLLRLLPVLLVAVALLGLALVAPRAGGVAAQEATPGAEGEPEGVVFEPLAVTAGVALPSPGDLVVVRITLAPGAVLPSDPNDPSLGMVLLESGELTIRLDKPATITRAGTFAPAIATAEATGTFPAPEETVAANQTATLRAGDVFYAPASAGGEIRNDGAEPAVGLIFIVAPPEAEEGAPAAGTPGA